MVDVRGDVLRPPHGTTPAAVKANKIQKLSSFKSNENIHKREDGSYYVVSANKVYKDNYVTVLGQMKVTMYKGVCGYLTTVRVPILPHICKFSR